MKPQSLLSPVPVLCVVLFVGCGRNETRAPEPGEAAGKAVIPGEMVKIPAREFTMGSDTDPAGARKAHPAFPAHKVSLPDYWIDKYEVTNGQFLKFSIESAAKPEGDFRTIYRLGMEDFPVANVTLNDAKAYCQWAGKRLPTEEEWEKAARGPNGQGYPWGDGWEAGKANTNEAGYQNTLEVGKIAGDASPYGVHDMMGNVQEWTASPYKAYPGGPRDPGFNLGLIVVRGSSYALRANDKTVQMKLWYRSGFPVRSQYGIGLRCAADTEPTKGL